MIVTKIKNLKYSPSKNKKLAKISEIKAKRNRFLYETDWTQIPDVNLTKKSKRQWMEWRDKVRSIKVTGDDLSNYFDLLESLDSERYNIITEYESSKKSLDDLKKELHSTLVSYYNNRVKNNFSPNLDIKVSECLDIISLVVSKSQMTLDTKDILGIIEQIPDDIKMDCSEYPFFNLTMSVKNFSVKDTLNYIIEQKLKEKELALHEERTLLHYEHRIDFIEDFEDLKSAREEIEENYGY